MKTALRFRAALVAVLSLALSACFTMNHTFPPEHAVRAPARRLGGRAFRRQTRA